MKKTFSLLLVMCACLLAATTSAQAAVGFLKIHMMSAADGRGDCFIIELPDNTKMVVDIPDGWNTALVNKLNALGFGGGIKYLVGTHEHIDHIGGMNNFINGFTINNTQIYYPKGSMNTSSGSYANLVTAAGNKGLAITKLVAGDYIINTTHDGKPFKVRVLSPENSKVNGGADDWSDPNEASFILKIQYGTKAILLQADCWGYNEMEVLAGPYSSEINACQVLKVGHHGTAAPGGVTSTRTEYLDAAGVNKALITDGDKAINATIKSRLQARNIRYWSTGDGDGYCWLSTDGASNWVESEDPLWPPAPTVIAPSITTQPVSQTVNPGANVTFTVAATGTAPLGYQWRFNGVDIADANAVSYTISNVQSGNAGNYSVEVENAAGAATSANAVLTVRVPPAITTQPLSQTVNAGANVTFSVTATGTAPLTYQWRFNAANISGATAASYTKSNAQSGDAGNYSVVVNNLAGSATSANAALTVNVPPSITTQPSSQTVNPGANVTFSVTATGTAPLTYQWRLNAANISGATVSSFTKSNVQTGDAGNYSVVVGNVAGSATSANAVLSVNVPPSITTQPSSQTVNPGANVTFTVAASGTAPLTYQWTFNGANISGAAATSYTKSNAQSGDAGNYSVVVGNVAGSATSANAVLSVNVPPSITTQPSSQTVNPGANVTFTVAASGTAPLTYQWTFNGANISGATATSYTKSNAQSGDAGNYAVVVSNVAGSATSANAVLSVNVPPSITTQPASQTVNPGANVTFSVTATGTAPLTYQWRLNAANISGATASSYTKSNVQSGDAGNYSVVVGNVAGSATSANAALTVNVPPSITTQPASQTVNPGANVTFTVAASGTAPLTYQWTFNGANISGATATSYTKSNAQSGDAGNYAVVVGNVAGSATSANAALTVNVPPSITTQPSSQTVNPGANVTFTVAASGTAPLTYQWTFNGANISGATATSYTKSNVQSGDAGNYSVVVGNVAGSATSANAALTVNVPPSITTQPSSQTVNPGANVTFSVTATGTAPLTYQWRFNAANISGATATSYTKSNAQSGDAGNYSVVVGNVAGSATSANATLSVNVPPSITTQPASQTVNSGANVTFTVVAAGTAPLSYQWTFNGVGISGATTSSFTRSNAQGSHAGNYAVVVTNVAGSVTSANAVLTVTTTIVSDTYNVTTAGTGFGLNAGVNTGINPPTTRLTGSTISNLRYIQTVTTRPASSYDINTSRLRVTSGNTIGRFTLSANGTAPFDFGPALGSSTATPGTPASYDVKISLRNDATDAARMSFSIATVDADINNMDFGVQIFRASSGNSFYTIQKRIDRGSFNGTTTTDGTGDVNATMVTAQANTAATMMDFLIRVTDAGLESGSSYNSRIQVSTNAGNSWIYDTASDSAVLNRFRFDGTGRHFVFDQAGNTTGNVFYDAFSVTTWNTAPPQSRAAPTVNNFETWKASYGITDPNADNDGDGQSNYAEYIANTNPNDGASALKIIGAKCQSDGQATLTWSSVGGVRYRVQYADEMNGEFTDIERDVAVETDPGNSGESSTQSFTDSVAPTNSVRFYRIKVVP